MLNLDLLHGMTKRQLIDWMMTNNLLEALKKCEACNEPLVLKPTKRNHDELGWRCFKSGCLKYATWILIFPGYCCRSEAVIICHLLLVDRPSTI